MTDQKAKFPILKWAQRKDKLFITICVVHSKKPIVDLTDGKRIKYQGTDGTTNFAFDIELYDEIVKEESKYTLDSRNIFLNLKKDFRTILAKIIKRRKKYHWIEVDWMYYAEEDEEDEATQPMKPGQDFDDMPDMGEMDEDDEPNPDNKDEDKKEDDKKEEPKKEDEKRRTQKEDDKKEEPKKEEPKKE